MFFFFGQPWTDRSAAVIVDYDAAGKVGEVFTWASGDSLGPPEVEGCRRI